MNIHVKNDWKEHILHDQHRTVDNFTYALTKGETHETLKQPRKTELFANDNLTVHADSHTKVDGKWLGKAGVEIHLHAGEKMVLEAGTEMTLKAGGSWIKLDPSGVRMGGSRINLGGGADRAAARPLLHYCRKRVSPLIRGHAPPAWRLLKLRNNRMRRSVVPAQVRGRADYEASPYPCARHNSRA